MSGLERLEALSLILTSRCNMRCGYCYQRPKRRRSSTWTVVRPALDLLLESGRRGLAVAFCGGEPLLALALIRRAVEYVENERRPRMSVTYYLSTNGTLLTEEIAGYLEERDFQIQLSFDGVAAAQNLRGRGTFPALDRLLDRLRTKHTDFYRENVTIALTVTPQNLPHLADSVSYFLRKGARNIAIAPSISSDADWELVRIGELDAQFARLHERSLSHFRRTGEIPVGIFRTGRAGSSAKRRARSLCGIGALRSITVDLDGEVYGCNMFAESCIKIDSPFLRTRLEEMRLGPIDDRGLSRRCRSFPAAVRRAGMFHRKVGRHSAYGDCGSCRYLARCFICPSSICFVPGNDDPGRVSDFCCAFTRVSLKYQRRFHRGRRSLALPTALQNR
jgi:sulfatase maturation enzyme AslB (radical SAM superfamily)